MTDNYITPEGATSTLTEATGYAWEWWHTGGGCYALHADQSHLAADSYALITFAEGPFDRTEEEEGFTTSDSFLIGLYHGDEPEPFYEQIFPNWDALISEARRQKEAQGNPA